MSRTAQPEAAVINDHAPIHAEKNAVSRLAEEAHESFGTVQFTPAAENPGNNVQVAAMLDGFSLAEGTSPLTMPVDAPSFHPSTEINQTNAPGEYPNHEQQAEQPPHAPQNGPAPESGPPPELNYPGSQTPAFQHPELSFPSFQQEAPTQSPNLQYPEVPTQVPNQTSELPTSQTLAGLLGQPGQSLDAQSQAQVPGAGDPLAQAVLGMLAQNGDATPTQQAALGIGQSIMSGLMSSMSGLGDSSGGSDSSDGSDGSDDSGNSDGSDSSSSSDGSDNSAPSDNSDNSASDSSDGSQDASSFSMPAWMQQYTLAGF